MSLKIKHKRSGALNSPPTAAQIEQGEIGINYNKDSLTLYVKDSDGVIRPVAGDGSQGPGKSTAQATAPASPADGDLWIDTSKNPPELKLWDDTGFKWNPAGSVPPETTAPSSPAVGRIWVDAGVIPNVTRIWDGTTWVAFTGSLSSAATAPTGPVTGQVWIDTSSTPSVTKIWNGTSWVSAVSSPTGDSAIAAEAKYATKAELNAAGTGQWTKVGTELNPKTDGDDVVIKDSAGTSDQIALRADGSADFTGDVKIGGTLPSAPNIELESNGKATFAAALNSPAFSLGGATNGWQIAAFGMFTATRDDSANPVFRGYQVGDPSPNVFVTAGGSAQFADTVSIGGASLSDPNISLNEDGSADFTGDVKVGGTLPSAPAIRLDSDGSATFSNGYTKITSVGAIIAGRSASSQAVFTGKAGLATSGTITSTIYGSGAAEFERDVKSLRFFTSSDAFSTSKVQFGYMSTPAGYGDGHRILGSNTDLHYYTIVDGDAGQKFYVTDSGTSVQLMELSSSKAVLIGGTLPSAPNITLKEDGNINALGLAAAGRVYADNTAAKAGGLVDGDFYRKTDGTLMVAFT